MRISQYFFVLLLLFLYPTSMDAQNAIANGMIINGQTDVKPSWNIVHTDSSVIVTYEFDGLNLLQDTVYPSTVRPRIAGFGYNHTPGKPEVPEKWDAVSLPLNSTGYVNLIDSTFADFSVELSPSRNILICGEEEYSTANVPKITPYKGFFPSSVIPDYEQISQQGFPLLNVCISPVKYSMETKTIRVFKKIQYEVTWKNDTKAAVNLSPERYNTGRTFLRKVALNNIITENSNQNPVTTEDYLIITTQKYQPAVERFAEWKRILGFRTEILYQNGWSTDSVRSYIRHFYSTHSNLNYVLFFGDLSAITSYQYAYDFNSYPSDYQYGCMDNDNFPDIFLGRLLVSSLDEAEILVDKIINYERNPVNDESFYNTGINGAVFESDANGYERTRAVLTSELINKVVSDSLQKEIKFVYLRGGGAYPIHWNGSNYSYGNELPETILQNISWDGTAKKMMNYINSGAFYSFFIGHGEWDKWESLKLDRDSLDKLSNGIKRPVVFSMSCQTGNFSHTDCFAQHFCSLEGNGCVGIIAATCNAPFGSTEILGMDMIDAIWPSSYFNPLYPNGHNSVTSTPDPTYRLGQILHQGIYKMRMTWDYNDLYTSRIFHCFGDPSMRIFTQKPTTFENATIVRGNGCVEIHAGEDEAEISIYNKTTGEIVCYKGLQCSYNYGDDEISICISGPNKIPYIDPLYLQNEEIVGPVEYDGGAIKAGYSVTSQKTFGNIVFKSGEIKMKGSSVEFQGGTSVELGTNLSIKNR